MYFKKCKKKKKTSDSYTEKYQDHIPCSIDQKFICVYKNEFVLYRGENAAYNFIKMILEEFFYCKKVMKNILTKL